MYGDGFHHPSAMIQRQMRLGVDVDPPRTAQPGNVTFRYVVLDGPSPDTAGGFRGRRRSLRVLSDRRHSAARASGRGAVCQPVNATHRGAHWGSMEGTSTPRTDGSAFTSVSARWKAPSTPDQPSAAPPSWVSTLPSRHRERVPMARRNLFWCGAIAIQEQQRIRGVLPLN